jgi:putative ABC transport system permease protein
MHTFLTDLRYGARLLNRTRGFTVVAVAALAIGIGANLAIFGFAKALLLSPPAGIAGASHVARVFTDRFSGTSQSSYEAYRDRNRSFTALAAFRPESVNLRTDGSPEQHFALSVSGNYFSALGVSAAIGRPIVSSDDEPGAPGVVVLSDRWWRLRFGGSPAVIGRTLMINGRAQTIVGVAPPEFTGTIAPLVPDAWLPLVQSARGAAGTVHIIGRLRPDVTIAQAQADLTTLATPMTPVLSSDPQRPLLTVYTARTLVPEIAVPAALFAGFLQAVVGLVLLLACVNIANLLLARSAGRSREISVRLALGASRRRLIRQLLTESLALSLLGGAAAAVLTLLAARPITTAVASLPTPLPVALTFSIDWPLVMAAIALAAATALAFGLVPAIQSSKPELLPALKEGTGSGGPKRSRLRAAFMTLQVAMSTLLLVLAGLLVRGVTKAHAIDRGLVTDGVLTASIDLESSGYSTARGIAFYDQLRARLDQSPGVVASNLAAILPLTLSNSANEMVKEATTPAETAIDRELVYQNIVSPGHFATLDIPLVAGRDFNLSDRPGATAVVIVNELLARRLWPNEPPLGKRLRQRDGPESFGPWLEVVGVARDSKYVTVGEDPRPFMYQPLAQAYQPTAKILVKGKGAALEILPALRTAVNDLDPNLPISSVTTLDAATSLSVLPVKVAAMLAGTLGVLALLLGAVGLYGVMSYVVRQRTRELGIRIALGANPGSVVRLVTRQGILWTAVGLAFGLSAAFAVARLISGFLYGVNATDPLAFGAVTLLLAATSLIACYVPARRASRLDPLRALREE